MTARVDERGFTLLEMMVAVLIVGLVVTTFMQLFGASLRLEQKARGFDEIVVRGRQTFAWLLACDPRADDFPWSGTTDNFTWRLRLEAVEVRPGPEAATQSDEEAVTLRWTSELYRLVLFLQDAQNPGRHLRLVAYRQVSPGYFTDEFKEKHL
ncbi:MAG TPA: type II secretion system protein [Proteobacteria bacterium]|mgnify:CR=1 FL=1|nr:type II secretion system protein [Pseudomonadota bacterium]